MTAMRRGAKILSQGMTLTVENGPVKLIFGSCRKEENDFVLGLKLKPIQYNDTMMPTDERKTEVLKNCSKQSEKKWNFYMRAYEKQEKSENFDDKGNATLKTTTEDKEAELDQDF